MIKSILIILLNIIYISSIPNYEIYPEENIMLNLTNSDFITFIVKVKDNVDETFTIKCFEHISYKIEGEYDTVWKTKRGSVIFQKGEKANTEQKLQCIPDTNLINVTIVVVINNNTTKTDKNTIEFVPKYVVKPKYNKLTKILANTEFTLDFTIYEDNNKNISIDNNIFVLKNNEKTIKLINCDKIPIKKKKDNFEINCKVEESPGIGTDHLERVDSNKIENIVPKVSGEVTFEEEKKGSSNSKYLKTISWFILLFLFIIF